MNAKKLEAAVTEANRFLVSVAALKENAAERYGCYDASRYTGSVRRASMDLTRALADLRSSRN